MLAEKFPIQDEELQILQRILQVEKAITDAYGRVLELPGLEAYKFILHRNNQEHYQQWLELSKLVGPNDREEHAKAIFSERFTQLIYSLSIIGKSSQLGLLSGLRTNEERLQQLYKTCMDDETLSLPFRQLIAGPLYASGVERLRRLQAAAQEIT